MSIWGWAAVALFVGPIVAALMVPILKWMLGDWRRLLLAVVAVAGGVVGFRTFHEAPRKAGSGHFLLEKD